MTALAAATLSIAPAQAASTPTADPGAANRCHIRHHHVCIDPGYSYQHGSHHSGHHSGASHRGHH